MTPEPVKIKAHVLRRLHSLELLGPGLSVWAPPADCSADPQAPCFEHPSATIFPSTTGPLHMLAPPWGYWFSFSFLPTDLSVLTLHSLSSRKPPLTSLTSQTPMRYSYEKYVLNDPALSTGLILSLFD